MSKKETAIIGFLDRDYRNVAEIKLKSKFHKLDDSSKIKVLESIIRWGREEINNIHPEQE